MVQVTRFAVNTTKPGTQDDVQVARLTDGSIIAVWSSSDEAPTYRNIRSQHFDHLGNPIGAEFIVNTERPAGLEAATYFQQTPDVAALADGGYIVTYLDNRPTTSQPYSIQNVLVGQRFDANDQRVGTDASLTPVFIAQDTPYRAAHSDAVGLPGGGYLMTFTARALDVSDAFADPDTGIRVSGYTGTTPFTPSTGGDLFRVKTVNTLSPGIQTGSKIEALSGGQGRAVIVWNTDTVTEDGIQFGYQLKAQIVDASGSKIGAEITIPRLARLEQSTDGERYDIAALSDGGFVVAFEQFPTQADFSIGKRTSLYLQIYNADGSKRGDLIAVEPPDGTVNQSPTVAAHSDGTFMVAWVDNPDMAAGGLIKGQFFQSNGIKIGAAFAIGETLNPTQKNPEAVLTGNGTYFVAWEDNGRGYGEPDIGLVGAIVDPQGSSGGGSALIASLVGASTHAETNATSTYEIRVRLDKPATTPVTIFYTVEGGATNPITTADLAGGSIPSSGQVVFAAGEQEKAVALAIAGDALVEGDETFKVLIFTADPNVSTNPSIQTVTVIDDDGTGEKIGVTVQGAYIAEQTFTEAGAPGVVNNSFVIKLDKAATKTETLSWSVVLGSASSFNAAASDFRDGVVPSGTLTFLAGETEKTVLVPILADAIKEEDEAFLLRVSNPSSGLKLTNASETMILIADDDTATGKIGLTFPAIASVLEGTSAAPTRFDLTLKLEKAAAKTEIVDWFVKLGPNFSTVDFADFAGGTPPSGTVYFQPGETEKTVTIELAADNALESSEFFTFAFSGLSSGLQFAGPTQATITILDDDGVTVTPSTEGDDVVIGTNSPNAIKAGNGRDKIAGLGGDDDLDGGPGVDIGLYSGSAGEYDFIINGSVVTVQDRIPNRDGTDLLANVERLQFADKLIAVDISGNAAQAYRVYQAAFDRTPDIAGISYWINQIDQGLTLRDVTYGFVVSSEFKTIYGSTPTAEELIAKFYLNVLGRAAEQAGFEYWVSTLKGGAQLLDVLAGFTESQENIARVQPAISSGIEIDASFFV